MPKKPEGELSWEPVQEGSRSYLLLKLGSLTIGRFYVDTIVEDYRTILKKMIDCYNEAP